MVEGDTTPGNDNTAPGGGVSISKIQMVRLIRGPDQPGYASSPPKYFSPSPTPKFWSAAKSGSARSGR